MADINGFLDGVFSEGAKQKETQQRGKVFSYELYTNIYRDVIKASGKCEVISRRYDRGIDCDILSCIDISTGENFSCNQFIIELSEV